MTHEFKPTPHHPQRPQFLFQVRLYLLLSCTQYPSFPDRRYRQQLEFSPSPGKISRSFAAFHGFGQEHLARLESIVQGLEKGQQFRGILFFEAFVGVLIRVCSCRQDFAYDCVWVRKLMAMRAQPVMSRRNRQQVQEGAGQLVTLVKTIFMNGVMVMLAPILAPLSLAIQLWNSLPTWRQVRRSVPTSSAEVCRLPRSVWNSIPSLGQIVNMLVGLVQAAVRDYMNHFSAQGIANSARQPVQAY